MKDCLYRNQDVLSAQCKNDYVQAFDAIQKRVAARSAVTKLCERDVAKFCAGSAKGQRPGCGLLVGGAARREHKLQQGHQRSGVSLMSWKRKCRRGVGLLVVALIGFAALPCQAQTQAGGTADDWVNKLAGLDVAPDLDVAALRQQAAGANQVESRCGADKAAARRRSVAQAAAIFG